MGISHKLDDSSSAIGRRYARNDELGTPFAITVDFVSLKDNTVTLRERDSTKQIRQPLPVVLNLLEKLTTEQTTWLQLSQQYPAYSSTDSSVDT